MTMSNRWIPLTLCAATAIPYALLGGFGSADSILPLDGGLPDTGDGTAEMTCPTN